LIAGAEAYPFQHRDAAAGSASLPRPERRRSSRKEDPENDQQQQEPEPKHVASRRGVEKTGDYRV